MPDFESTFPHQKKSITVRWCFFSAWKQSKADLSPHKSNMPVAYWKTSPQTGFYHTVLLRKTAIESTFPHAKRASPLGGALFCVGIGKLESNSRKSNMALQHKAVHHLRAGDDGRPAQGKGPEAWEVRASSVYAERRLAGYLFPRSIEAPARLWRQCLRQSRHGAMGR